MRGEISSYDPQSGAGQITGDDGIRYEFNGAVFQGGATPSVGQRVDFVGMHGTASDIMVIAAQPTAQPDAPSTSGFSGSGAAAASDSIDWGKLFFSFDGRTRRSHFWIAWLILLVGGFVLGLIPILGALISIALIWPNLAIAVKRLHDMGKTGWLVLIPWVVGLIALIAGVAMIGVSAFANAAALETEDPAVIMATFGPAIGVFLVSFLIQLAFLLWVGLSDSQRGQNRFGANPKGQ